MRKYRLPVFVRRLIVFAAGILLLVGIGMGIHRLSSSFLPSVDPGKQLGSVTADATIQPFGEKVVTFDGSLVQCFDAQGNTSWTFPAEVGSKISVSEKNLVIWKGRSVTMLDESGGQVFSKSLELDSDILDARVSASYVAVQVGSVMNSQIIVLDRNSQQIDREEFPNRRMLDFGFFGSTVDMLWTMALDTAGRVPVTYVATYQPGKNMNGFVTVSDQLIYRTMFHQSEMMLVGSQNLLYADYAESKISPDKSKLLYGWYLKDGYLTDNGWIMLFAPSPEPGAPTQISDLRILRGTEQKTIHLAYPVDDVLCSPNYIFGFKGEYIYVYDYDGVAVDSALMRFTIDNVVGLVGTGRAVVTAGQDVHIVRLR